MTGVKKVSSANNALPKDPGLDKLFSFIKASLTGYDSRKRLIYTDAKYQFTVQTEFPSGVIERRTVRIAAGQPL
jgi:hypothetical protein